MSTPTTPPTEASHTLTSAPCPLCWGGPCAFYPVQLHSAQQDGAEPEPYRDPTRPVRIAEIHGRPSRYPFLSEGLR